MAPMQYYLPVALWPGFYRDFKFATVNLLRSQGMFYELSAFIGTSQYFLNIAGYMASCKPSTTGLLRASEFAG